MTEIKPGTVIHLEPESAVQRFATFLEALRANDYRELPAADAEKVLATALLAERLMDGLERVQSRVSGLLHFDANESAPPEDERWARDLDELNTYVTGIYVELENAYAAAEGVIA